MCDCITQPCCFTTFRNQQVVKAKKHGFDIEGYTHSIDNYFVKHELNRGKNLTDDDFRNIPNVINNPDFIIYGSTVPSTGNKAITYVKNGNKSCVFVEEIRTGKNTLAAQSISKTAKTFDVSSIKNTPELYAHSDPGSIQIVDVKNEIVNPHTGLTILKQPAFHGSGANFEQFRFYDLPKSAGRQRKKPYNEIVDWRRIDIRGLKKMERQQIKNNILAGGQSHITGDQMVVARSAALNSDLQDVIDYIIAQDREKVKCFTTFRNQQVVKVVERPLVRSNISNCLSVP